MKKTVLILFLLLLAIPCSSVLAAEQTGNCHCFRNRIYNPADKYAADDYLLTTVFNSLTAQHFSISKRQIVMMKMKGGVPHNDLLIGLYISKCTGTDVSDLLAQKGRGSWKQVLSSITSQPLPQSDCEKTWQLIHDLPATEAAEIITQKMFLDRFSVSDSIFRSLQAQGLVSREIALVLVLAGHMQVEPEDIYIQYKNKGLSWSEIAYNFGLEPADVGKFAGQSPSDQK